MLHQLASGRLGKQAASTRAISTRVAQLHRTAQAHSQEEMPGAKQLNVRVGLVGPGLIGSAFVAQVNKQAENLKDVLKANITIAGIANSKKMVTSGSGLDFAGDWKAQLAQGQPVDLDKFAASLRSSPEECVVIVDCTASDDVPAKYLDLMRAGCHIVAPNKKFGAGPLERYNALKDLSLEMHRFFMFEGTVGAGLPIISTLRSLLETGDKVLKIEGILSGTLSYIFNTYKGNMRFSDVVADAKAKGYTEPDPREDLSGTDVARKVVILARKCGLPVELDSMAVDSLVPKALEGLSVDEFMRELPKYDAQMSERAQAAEARGEVVRYVGVVDVEHGSAKVTLQSYPAGHAFAQLSGSDNLLVFTTERYKDRPLIVRGPGAGAEVTAAGVFSDVIQVVRQHRSENHL